MTADELAEFFGAIGAAIWHCQYLEDILVQFLSGKIIHERRCSDEKVHYDEGMALIADKRKITLGPLIDSCYKRKIIKHEDIDRFLAFKENRHWLVHRSLTESGDDLYLKSTRMVVFERIAAVEDDAVALKKIVVSDLDIWLRTHGVDLESTSAQAREDLRKLKGE